MRENLRRLRGEPASVRIELRLWSSVQDQARDLGDKTRPSRL